MEPRSLEAPSGRILHPVDLELLRAWAHLGTIRYSEKTFTLNSGIKSHVYVNAREDLTHNPPILAATGNIILMRANNRLIEMFDPRRPHFLGLPDAGTPLATAAAIGGAGAESIHDMPACSVVRKVQKTTHGATEHRGGWVVGKNDLNTYRYFAVDNVATSGKTILEWVPRFVADGFEMKDFDWIILVDRQQGAVERLRQNGIENVLVVYNLLDITFAYRTLGLWPEEAVAQVEREIAAHQFT